MSQNENQTKKQEFKKISQKVKITSLIERKSVIGSLKNGLRVNDEDIDYSHEFNESEEFEISEILKDLLLNHIPPSSLSLDNASNSQKKKLKLTNSETILASSDTLTAGNQTKSDKITIAKLGRWVPLIYNRGNQQYGVLASPSSASLLLQDSQESGTLESPIPDGKTCSTSLVKTDGDNLIAHIKST
ncbi:hypothetical protein MFLAVUS_002407 [Mucor flavus]|uniref:Uncharacterized protein n=1 Tax=Mucor flavus TaxID=439312 RepID=A0ABP9YQ58_9FUNG